MQASSRIRAFALVAVTAGLTACIDVDGLTYDLEGTGGGGTTSSVASASTSSSSSSSSSSTAGGGGGGAGGAGQGGAGGGGPRTYFDVVMEDGPAGYWRFDADSQLVADLSGNGHDAVAFAEEANGGFVTRAVTGAIDGDADRALYLGGGAYVVVSPNPFEIVGAYTFEAWVMVDESVASNAVFRWLSNADPQEGFHTFFRDTSVNHKRYDGLGGYEEMGVSPTVLNLSFHHLVVTADGSEGRIYVDGELVEAPDNLTLTIPDHTGAFLVADTVSGGSFTVDEAAFYPAALPLQRVEAHYRCGALGECD